jgi:hypothetical protein
MSVKIQGASGTIAEVNVSSQLKIVPETDASANPSNVGAIRVFSENDTGTGLATTPQLFSPETDLDYRLRAAMDTFFDQEIFDYTAQNTGKHTFTNTTMTAAWTVTGLLTNSGSIVTTNTGLKFSTYGFFPIVGTSTLSLDFAISFSALAVSNTTVDAGLFLPGAALPYAPTDGVYFRLTSAGLFGVTNFNGSETITPAFSFVPSLNQKYQFILYIYQHQVEFWVNDGVSTDLYGILPIASGNPAACASAALPFALRHAIGAAAGAVEQVTVGGYNIRLGGPNHPRSIGEFGNAAYGSYQGLSGGTMGSLANYANSANPAAAVPTNTTAALGTGLGGQIWETDTLAVTTDGIILSFQNPAGTVSVQGRRMRVTGVTIESYVQTALTGGGYNAQWSLAFGHTAVSLATAEAATTKAPRRVALGVQSVAAAAAAIVKLETVSRTFQNPIYVNPGEFIAVVKKKVGTAPSAGVIAHVVTYDYSWE